MKNLFEQTVVDHFRFLQDKFGFSAPVTEDFGREIFVRYKRADQIVSISWELGSSPRIEIFHPSVETGTALVPWASRDGVQRSRRFPKVRPTTRFNNDETTMVEYLEESAHQFEEIEAAWLKG